MIARARVSLDTFLAMPETKPASELIDGEVVQKVARNVVHAFLTTRIIVAISNYLETHPEARIGGEMRHVLRQDERVIVPDISIVRRDRVPRTKAELMAGLEAPPDFAVEVLSPGTSYPRTAERAAFFMRAGTDLLWIVDPEDEVIAVHRPGEPVTFHRAPEAIDARPVLTAFTFDLGELFAVLHSEDED